MISLYKILTDKYGKYFISNGKKRRLKTIEKKYEQVFDKLQHYQIIMINDTEYIRFS